MSATVLFCRQCGGIHIQNAATDDHVAIAVQCGVRMVTINGRAVLSREGLCQPCAKQTQHVRADLVPATAGYGEKQLR